MSGKMKRLRAFGVITVSLMLTLAVALAALSFPFTTVTTDSVKLRRSASSTATVLENLEKGATVEVIGESGNYYKVSYNNRTGYVMKEFISTDASVMVTPTPEPVETAEGYPYTTVTRDGVNLRANKSTRSTLLKKIPKGATITVNAVSGTWAEVTYGGRTGYVKTDYIVLKTIQKKQKETATPTPAPTLSPEEETGDYQILQKGDSGTDVKALQEALIELGYMTGTADGKFGAATENAVIQFQNNNGYPTTGIMDANIQAFLYSGKPKDAKGNATKVKTVSPVSGASIKKGNTGDAVTDLQSRLKELGYYSGEITGTVDTATTKAIKSFQKKNGLTASGTADAATQRTLYSSTALSADATPTPEPTPTPTPIPTFTIPETKVKLNSEGADAKTVQQRLKDLGYYKGNVDGKFGRASVNALKKFQEAHGLEADGVAGDTTYALLFSLNALPSGATPTPAPTTESGITVTTTLRKGDGGDEVAVLQETLIALNYLSGTADGNYGEKTAAAVRAFQKANGLTQDGTAGPETLTLLYSGTATAASTATPRPTSTATAKSTAKAKATPTPTATVSASGTLKQGDKGDEVKSLQKKLIELGYLTGKADGVFGKDTYQAVVAFQQANSLTADGIAGSKTVKKLNSSSAKSASGSTATATPTKDTSQIAAITSKPSAGRVIYANWYTKVKSVCRNYPYATIYDYQTGISWQIHMFSLGAHADYEPLTANDTAKMLKAFGKNTWNPRAVWVVFADGSVYMASTHSMPHDTQHIKDNNFDGHSCLHFPRTQEEVAAIGSYATSHQETIDAGWAVTQSMAK